MDVGENSVGTLRSKITNAKTPAVLSHQAIRGEWDRMYTVNREKATSSNRIKFLQIYRDMLLM